MSLVADQRHQVVYRTIEAERADIKRDVIIAGVIPFRTRIGLGVQLTGVVVVDNHQFGIGTRHPVFLHDTLDSFLLRTMDENLEGISLGDGPIDAAFLAIEQITGRHYELDDFQIKAVTEGKETAAETIVKLLANGKVYSGRGLSTDIIGASVRAYLNAVNKVIFEEEA